MQQDTEKELSIIEFRNDWQKASIKIFHTYSYVYNYYEQFFKRYELTSQQYNILRILRNSNPTPLTTSTLRERMLDKMSDASRLVARLNTKGLVEVKKNAADKRLVDIVISKKGEELLLHMDSDLVVLDKMLQEMSHEEVVQLGNLLDKARESVRNSMEETFGERTNQEDQKKEE